MLNKKKILLTGGTGSFGKHFTNIVIKKFPKSKIIVFSRDEMKQWDLKNKKKHKNLKFIIGDVRDRLRLEELSKNVDIIIHAAATKIVPTAEENPSECIKTNVLGAMNVINAAKKNNVQKVIALSTDKACNPVNLYGATKLISDKLFVLNNDHEIPSATKFSVVRYGNVINSRGSVIPFFKSFKPNSVIPITDPRMTRFMITLDEAVKLVLLSIKDMVGGEIFVQKVPSMNIIDLAEAIHPKLKTKNIGIRPGEKIHEELISANDARNTYEYADYFKILPENTDKKIIKKMIKKGKKVKEDFQYSSNKNKKWLSKNELKKIIQKIYHSK